MKNFRIATQLAIGFGLMVLLVMASSAMVWWESIQSEQRDQVARDATTGAVALAQAQSALWQLRYGFPQFMVGDEAARRKIVEDEPAQYALVTKALEAYAAARPSAEERAQLKAVQTEYARYIAARPKWFELYGSGKLEEAAQWRAATTTPFGAATVKAFGDIIALQQQVSLRNHEAGIAELEGERRAMVALALIALAAGCILAWMLSAAITRPLHQAVAAARRVADGDLTVEVSGAGGSTNEVGQLLQALSAMTSNLRSLVGQVAAGARTVAESSGQIAQGNADLSQRTEEQAGTLEETASSMEELTSTVTQNADTARQASQLAIGASEVARKGGDVVGQVVHTMTDIADSSRKIGDIISVIDGIAFQTNILALNAAVEAARAGEQGRGFAVVAAEVRNLAQRSASAAKEIKVLIGDSTDKVDAGTRLVDAAGGTMKEIVASVKQVSDLIAEIAAASQEQSTGIGQVNTAVAQMEQVVQQNASLVEQATAATESMKVEAGSLLQIVSRFNIGAAAGGAANEAAPPPAPPAAIRFKPSSRLPAPFAPIPAMGRRAQPAPAGEWNEF